MSKLGVNQSLSVSDTSPVRSGAINQQRINEKVNPMKLILITSLLALTGCAGSKYTVGDFAMAFLAAKANSNSTQNAYNRGLSAQYPDANTAYQQNQFTNFGYNQALINQIKNDY